MDARRETGRAASFAIFQEKIADTNPIGILALAMLK
jgi:hypothetical protein